MSKANWHWAAEEKVKSVGNWQKRRIAKKKREVNGETEEKKKEKNEAHFICNERVGEIHFKQLNL